MFSDVSITIILVNYQVELNKIKLKSIVTQYKLCTIYAIRLIIHLSLF